MRTWISFVLSVVLALVAAACTSQSAPRPQTAPQSETAATPAAQSGFLKVDSTPTPSQLAAPTLTPGVKTLSKNRLLYVRNGKLVTANADGSDKKTFLSGEAPELFAPPRDPGRVWLSPSGKWLAFLGGADGELWTVGMDGGNLRRVSDALVPPEGVGGSDKDREDLMRRIMMQEIAWTKDETRLALIGAPKGTVDLFVVDLGAGRAIQATDDAPREDRLAWSPDGTRLAYTSYDERFASERLQFVNGDGSGRIDVSNEPIATTSGLTATAIMGGIISPTWLDTNRVFFYPASLKGSLGIWSYDVTTGAHARITDFPVATPDWSPVSRRWVMGKQSQGGVLFTLGPEGGEPKVLVSQNGFAPLWSPDGKQIVYSSGPDASAEQWEIRVINADGSNDRSLGQNLKVIGFDPPEPSPTAKRFWSNDGQNLLFTVAGSSYGSSGPDLENWWTVPVSGGQPRRLTDLEQVYYLQRLQMAPDGQSFAFVGLSYMDRSLHLWTFAGNGGYVTAIDGPVRWFTWMK